jgi:hypothetical protein
LPSLESLYYKSPSEIKEIIEKYPEDKYHYIGIFVTQGHYDDVDDIYMGFEEK